MLKTYEDLIYVHGWIQSEKSCYGRGVLDFMSLKFLEDDIKAARLALYMVAIASTPASCYKGGAIEIPMKHCVNDCAERKIRFSVLQVSSFLHHEFMFFVCFLVIWDGYSFVAFIALFFLFRGSDCVLLL